MLFRSLFEFCKKFPELTSLQSGKFVSTRGGYSWVTNAGKALVDPDTGRVIVFSSDVKDFLIYASRNRTTLTKYLTWYAGMPGKIGKITVGTGYAFDAYTVNTSISDLMSVDPEITDSLPVNERISITQIMEGSADQSLITDIYSRLLEIQPQILQMQLNTKIGRAHV